jgi:tRNA threonylcarbamoyladenosine dehydratase
VRLVIEIACQLWELARIRLTAEQQVDDRALMISEMIAHHGGAHECDSLPVKYALRVAERAQRVNMLSAADERGFLRVEPHAEDPSLLEVHGPMSAAPKDRAHYATARAFMRDLTEWVGGWDQISAESRASIEQIGITLCGYPQLASEARFAAGQLGHVARRLLLGAQFTASTQQLDLDRLVPSTQRIA